eukprot:gene929-1255_t
MWGSIGLNTKSLQNALKKYGRSGIVTYLGLSTMVTTGFYVAIKQNVDVKKIVGITEDPDKEPGLLQKLLLGPGSHIALAILCSKAMIPLKLPMAGVAKDILVEFLSTALGKAVDIDDVRDESSSVCLGSPLLQQVDVHAALENPSSSVA